MPTYATYEAGQEPIAGYRLVDLLGRGLFGEVWVADDIAAGRIVAMKLVNLQFSGGTIADFRILARMTALSHPHLVPVYTVCLKDRNGKELDFEHAEISRQRGELQELIIVMGLGEKSLGARQQELNPDVSEGSGRVGIPIEELICYMEGAAQGVDYLNQEDHGIGRGDGPIFHCNLNPRNMLIVNGEVQIADVGMAALLAPDARRTMAAGTPAYCAPEMAANQPGLGTDQYSLAITYYELRTGQLPFDDGMGHTSIIMAHAMGKLDFSSPVLTETEREVIKRATALHPSDRYPSCVKFVRALARSVEKIFPDKSTRTLKDTQGVPYPSPLRPDSYWRSILTATPDPSVASVEPVPAMPAMDDGSNPFASADAPAELTDPSTPGVEGNADASDPTVNMQAAPTVKGESPPVEPDPGPHMDTPDTHPRLAYPSVRATPILLPLEDPLPSALGAPPALPRPTDTPTSPVRRGPLLPADQADANPVPIQPAPRVSPRAESPASANVRATRAVDVKPVASAPPPTPPTIGNAPREVRPPSDPSSPQDKPDWYKEAESFNLPPAEAAKVRAKIQAITEQKQRGPQSPREAVIEYSARMIHGRVSALTVVLPHELFRRTIRVGASDNPMDRLIEIEVQLPGCDCLPPRMLVGDLAEDQQPEFTFWVVPRVLGRVRGAQLLVRKGETVLAAIPLDLQVRTYRWAGWLAGLGMVFPYAMYALGPAPADVTPGHDFPGYHALWSAVWQAGPGWIGLIGVLLAIGAWLWARPRHRRIAGELTPA